MTVTPVAPAAAIAPSAASREAVVVGEAGQHRGEEDPARQAGVGERPDQVQPRPRGGHARLERGVQVVVPDRHGDAEPDRDLAAAASASSGMSRRSSVPFVRMENGVPESASAPMTPGISLYRPSARWYGSVFVPERDVLPLPGRPGQLAAQHVDEVRLDHDLGVEVAAGIELQPFVRLRAKQ